MRGFLNLAVIISGGVMLADILIHPQGAKTLFDGIGALWKTSINGMLGQTG